MVNDLVFVIFIVLLLFLLGNVSDFAVGVIVINIRNYCY